jgi:hypothetical protein
MTVLHSRDRRRFFRHPARVPIMCRWVGRVGQAASELRNISFGGMAFSSNHVFRPGDLIEVDYPTLNAEGLRGEVVWATALDHDTHSHLFGMRFLDESMFHRARIIEQLCRIEIYRQAQSEHQGHPMERNEAAQEWIAKEASHFPL